MNPKGPQKAPLFCTDPTARLVGIFHRTRFFAKFEFHDLLNWLGGALLEWRIVIRGRLGKILRTPQHPEETSLLRLEIGQAVEAGIVESHRSCSAFVLDHTASWAEAVTSCHDRPDVSKAGCQLCGRADSRTSWIVQTFLLKGIGENNWK
jgi:hypothetical protein